MTNTPKPENPNLDQALNYAKRGWYVFPLRPNSKRPATPKHTAESCDRTDPKCRDGHAGWEQRATVDRKRIRTAWTRNPGYGIGIACGPSGLLVVDLDIAKGGNSQSGSTVFNQLVRDSGEPYPGTFTVATPSGGYHLYYERPSGSAFGNSAGKLGSSIDTRATGGYVLAPPTVIGDAAYEVVENIAVAPLTDWLCQLLKPAERPDTSSRPLRLRFSTNRYAQAAVDGETKRIRNAGKGQRNHTLFTSAIALGQLAATEHYDPTNAETDLLEAASVHFGVDDFTEAEARKTIASGLRRGLTQPRQIRRSA